MITDYARGKNARLAGIREIHRKDRLPRRRARAIWPVASRHAGFIDVVVDDATAHFVDILRRDRSGWSIIPADFLSVFSETDLNYLVDRWEMKVDFCNRPAT